MTRPAPSLLQPRKMPQQARSAATIEAIHIATIQLLLADGVARLTTTRVAERAGVSVGTMYQYYPHKQALLFAIVERQLEKITHAMLTATARLEGSDLATVAEGLATAWIDAKMADTLASRAIYGIAAEFDLDELMNRTLNHMVDVIARLLTSMPDARFIDVRSNALMLATMLGGSVRMAMEAEASEDHMTCLRQELPRACRAYLAVAL